MSSWDEYDFDCDFQEQDVWRDKSKDAKYKAIWIATDGGPFRRRHTSHTGSTLDLEVGEGRLKEGVCKTLRIEKRPAFP
jgi:hypothetical protein